MPWVFCNRIADVLQIKQRNADAGIAGTDGSLMQNLFGSSGDRDASVCVTSFGATLGQYNLCIERFRPLNVLAHTWWIAHVQVQTAVFWVLPIYADIRWI